MGRSRWVDLIPDAVEIPLQHITESMNETCTAESMSKQEGYNIIYTISALLLERPLTS
jgi:hypothetical protein